MTIDALDAEQIAELLPAYALGAVDEPERTHVENYVAAHPEIETELVALRQVATRLRSDAGPSADVWDRIVRHIDDATEAAEPLPPDAVPVVVLHHERRRRRLTRGVIALAASLALLGGVAVALTGGADRQSSTLPPNAALGAAAAASNAPGAQQGTVTADDGASADVVVLPSRKGYVLAADLPRGAVYRLFAITARGPILVAILKDRLGPLAFELPEGATGLVLTDRPPGAVPPGDADPATPAPEATSPSPTPDTPPATFTPPTSRPGVSSPITPGSAPPLAPVDGLVPTSLPPLAGLG